MCRLIGLMGPLGHGKTTTAKIMVEDFGYQRVRMAGPLKDMLRTFGLTDAQVDGDQKEVPLQILCGHTSRYAQQRLGTEWGRRLIGEDVWVNSVQYKLSQMRLDDPDCKIVIDDIRFPNEVAMILANGGQIWRVVDPRKLVKPTFLQTMLRMIGIGREHISEVFWRRVHPMQQIDNQGTLEDLSAKVRDYITFLDEPDAL